MTESDASEMTSSSKPAAVTTGEQITLLIRALLAKIVDLTAAPSQKHLIAARSHQHERPAQVASRPEETHSLQHAPRANLDAVVRGNNASGLVASLSDAITAWEQASGKRKNVRRKGLENLKGASAAFAADLLHARNHPDADGWVYRPLAKGSFTKQAVSSRDFTSVKDAWIACGLLDHKPGFTETVEFDGDHFRTRGKAARFRATPKMLKVCAEHGVTPQNVGEHFSYPPPEHPLVLTSTSRRVGRWKEQGKPMEFKRTPRTQKLEGRVKELNAFIANHLIRGATHRWFRRIFHEGDQPQFDWNKGGRLYSDGKDSFQQLPRSERLKITIDGEPVCEIDIRASYLTILHALHKEPFEVSREHDPYAIEGLPRAVVKKWCAVRFGTKKGMTRWPSLAIREYAEDNDGADLTQYSVREVGQKVCKKHPLLKQWQELPETWADLMWLESQAVLGSMQSLMQVSAVPTLPIHDSLLVPVSREELAKEHLTVSYHHFCKVVPHLEAHYPTQPK
jgi:hypothetical protein